MSRKVLAIIIFMIFLLSMCCSLIAEEKKTSPESSAKRHPTKIEPVATKTLTPKTQAPGEATVAPGVFSPTVPPPIAPRVIVPEKVEKAVDLQKEKEYTEILRACFKGSINSMKTMLTKCSLPVDKFNLVTASAIQTTTSPTNIGMALTSFVAARDLGFIDENEARKTIAKMMNTISNLKRHESGLFYAWYEAWAKKPVVRDRYVPAIDNVNLTISLKIVAEAYKKDNTKDGKDIARMANEIINSQDYSAVYDPEKQMMVGGIDRLGDPVKWHPAETLGSESRLGSQVIPAMYDYMDNDSILRSNPLIINYELLSGEKIPVLATWDGGAFQMFLPHIFVAEDLNPAMKTLLENYVLVMKDQGKRRNILGIEMAAAHSACETGMGYNGSQGIAVLAQNADVTLPVKSASWESHITPHAIFLAGTVDRDFAVENLVKLRELSPKSYAKGFGFVDSVNARNGKAIPFKLALDEGMIMGSIYKTLDQDNLGLAKYLYYSNIGPKLAEIMRKQDLKLYAEIKRAGFTIKELEDEYIKKGLMKNE